MVNTARRIAAVEAITSDKTLKIIVVEDDEIQADALKRVGLKPDAQHVMCVVPLDVEL